MNLLFFFLLPIACCTNCLFSRKTGQDSDASICGRKVTRKQIDSDESSEEEESYGEYKSLLKNSGLSSTLMLEKTRLSSETVFNVTDNRSHQFDDIDDELEKDARFVVNAMNESHDSLSKLVSK